MKIISWNVRLKNKNIDRGLAYIFSKDPDIVCLQELPKDIFEELLEKYKLNGAMVDDFTIVKNKETKIGVNAIFTEHEMTSVENINYFKQYKVSPFQKILYEKLNNSKELHNLIKVNVKINGRNISIVNSRLSCALSKIESLMMLENYLASSDSRNTIYCGDLNTQEPEIINFAIGKTRSYTKKDYQLNHRIESEKLFRENDLVNIFSKKGTSILPFVQFDHILIPNTFKLVSYKLGPRFGSDHKILIADLSI